MSKKRLPKITRTNALTMELPAFKPLTQTQAEANHEYMNGRNLFLCGYAGTGKTYLAISMALSEIASGTKDQICIFRSAVASRDIGFLPGTEEEKMAVYAKAYPPVVNSIFKRDDAWEVLKNKKIITFDSTSFLRGTTMNDCVIIVDEVQNCDAGEINTLLTRVGENCRIIMCGDHRQADLTGSKSGFRLLLRTLEKISEYVSIHEFDVDDIVRSEFVRAWIIAFEEAKSEFGL